jgi:hypothetical protein
MNLSVASRRVSIAAYAVFRVIARSKATKQSNRFFASLRMTLSVILLRGVYTEQSECAAMTAETLWQTRVILKLKLAPII